MASWMRTNDWTSTGYNVFLLRMLLKSLEQPMRMSHPKSWKPRTHSIPNQNLHWDIRKPGYSFWIWNPWNKRKVSDCMVPETNRKPCYQKLADAVFPLVRNKDLKDKYQGQQWTAFFNPHQLSSSFEEAMECWEKNQYRSKSINQP